MEDLCPFGCCCFRVFVIILCEGGEIIYCRKFAADFPPLSFNIYFLVIDSSRTHGNKYPSCYNGVYITCDKTNYTKSNFPTLPASVVLGRVERCFVLYRNSPLGRFQAAHRLSFSRKSQQHTTKSIKARVRSGREVWQLRRMKIKFIKLNNGIFNFSVRNEGSVLSCSVYESMLQDNDTTTTTATAKGKLQDSAKKRLCMSRFVIK